jgi:hypothetical protein
VTPPSGFSEAPAVTADLTCSRLGLEREEKERREEERKRKEGKREKHQNPEKPRTFRLPYPMLADTHPPLHAFPLEGGRMVPLASPVVL